MPTPGGWCCRHTPCPQDEGGFMGGEGGRPDKMPFGASKVRCALRWPAVRRLMPRPYSTLGSGHTTVSVVLTDCGAFTRMGLFHIHTLALASWSAV